VNDVAPIFAEKREKVEIKHSSHGPLRVNDREKNAVTYGERDAAKNRPRRAFADEPAREKRREEKRREEKRRDRGGKKEGKKEGKRTEK
jgi:hypothetical protein